MTAPRLRTARSVDQTQLDILVGLPCDTLAALMTAQLPVSDELDQALDVLGQARELFLLAARSPART